MNALIEIEATEFSQLFKSGDMLHLATLNSNCQTMTEESKIVSNVRNMRERMVGRTKLEGLKKISKTAAEKDNTR